MNPYTTRPTPQHNYQRIHVLNEMRLHRKNMHKWIAEGKGRKWLNHYDDMQRKLDNLNIILFGTIAPGVIE